MIRLGTYNQGTSWIHTIEPNDGFDLQFYRHDQSIDESRQPMLDNVLSLKNADEIKFDATTLPLEGKNRRVR